MIDANAETALQWAGSGGLIVFLANMLWRVLSRGRVEGKREAAEINILRTLQEENKLLRDNIVLAYKERDEAKEQMAVMRTEMALLKRDLAEAEERMRSLKERIGDLDRRENG